MKTKNIYFAFFLLIFMNTSFSQNNNEPVKDSLTWYIYIGGKTSSQYIEAKTIAAKQCGLKTNYFYGDCVGTFDYKKAEFDRKNELVYAYLVKNYGVDWATDFQEQLQIALEKLTSIENE